MRLAPTYLAEVAAGDAADLLTPYGRQFGRRVEVDLQLLAADEPGLARHIERYLAQVEAFRRRPSGDYLALQVPLTSARQQDGRDGKVDLTGELEALEGSVIAPVAETLLAGELDLHLLRTLGACHRIEVETPGPARTACHLTVSGTRAWDRLLGGAAGPDEVARLITIEANHARWRDRKVRRLVAVHTSAAVVIPRPSPYTTAAHTPA